MASCIENGIKYEFNMEKNIKKMLTQNVHKYQSVD